MAARIFLLLGETFVAQEHLEQAYKSGKLKNLHGPVLCGLLEARILKKTEPADVVRDHLNRVSRSCSKSLDFHHGHIAEGDLARIESEMFP
jgi:hypothetical protein